MNTEHQVASERRTVMADVQYSVIFKPTGKGGGFERYCPSFPRESLMLEVKSHAATIVTQWGRWWRWLSDKVRSEYVVRARRGRLPHRLRRHYDHYDHFHLDMEDRMRQTLALFHPSQCLYTRIGIAGQYRTRITSLSERRRLAIRAVIGYATRPRCS